LNIASLPTGLLACSLLFFSAATGSTAQPDHAAIDLTDPELFPPEFFPDLADLAEEELLLAGLRSIYPERILTETPEAGLPDPAPPVVRGIGTSGVYIRVIHLPSALAVIEENLSAPLLVLDFRFLTADLESALDLGSLLTRQQTMELLRAGDYPVPSANLNGEVILTRGRNLRPQEQTIFTLSSHETRGPIEAVLAQLRNDGDVISVGAPSSGQTAVFRPFPGLESFYLISGEIRPSNGDSLTRSGFIPRVQVAVTRTEDRIAYGSLREGVSLEDLVEVRSSRPQPDETVFPGQEPRAPIEEALDPEEEPGLPQDIILQRALNIVKALQALGKIAG
jgi:hypothetical protein